MRCTTPSACPLCRAPESDNDPLLSAIHHAYKTAKDCEGTQPNYAAEHSTLAKWLTELYARRTGKMP